MNWFKKMMVARQIKKEFEVPLAEKLLAIYLIDFNRGPLRYGDYTNDLRYTVAYQRVMRKRKGLNETTGRRLSSGVSDD